MEQLLQEHLTRVQAESRLPDLGYQKTLVTDKVELDRLLDRLSCAPDQLFAYDTETNGTFRQTEVQCVGLSFAVDSTECWYVPVGHHDGDQLDILDVMKELKWLFESPNYSKVCHNAKFDEKVLRRYGIDVAGPGHDTYVMAWMLSEGIESKGLKQLIERIYGFEMETFEDVIGSAPKKKGVPRDYNFGRVPLESALSYAADDAYWTLKLYYHFKKLLEKEKLWDPYYYVEREFTRVLRKLEYKGVYIDQPYLEKADKALPIIAEKVEAAIYEQAGEVFNIGSGKQLGTILFDKLGIGNNVPTTASGAYKTDKKTLDVYKSKHPIVADVLRRKKIQKTHSVFVEGLKGFVESDGRVRPSFNGCGTVTGRLSCSSPNLQQIEGDEVEEIRVRNFFIPAPGNVFVVGDYGQVELRVMAHFSRDQNMIDAFLSGMDFHDATARLMFKLGPEDTVIHRQRFGAKAINFGIGYGRGPMSIAEQIGCTMVEAKALIKAWQETYPGVIQYKQHVLSQAREHGFVRTLTGRKRRLSDIRSNDNGLRARAERQAFNTKIQGSAADIIKMAMISLQPKLVKFDANLILQIHDELVIESPIDAAEEVRDIMQHTMSNPLKGKNPLRLPLTVDPKIVSRWGDAK